MDSQTVAFSCPALASCHAREYMSALSVGSANRNDVSCRQSGTSEDTQQSSFARENTRYRLQDIARPRKFFGNPVKWTVASKMPEVGSVHCVQTPIHPKKSEPLKKVSESSEATEDVIIVGDSDEESPGEFLQKADVAEFLDGVDNIFLDCDGVLWQGSSLIEGTLETLELLKDKRIFFVTNNSTKSRKQYVKKFEAMGITGVDLEQIVCSSFAAASFLKHIGFDKKAYVVGEAGISLELNKHGIEHTMGYDHAILSCSVDNFCDIDIDDDVGAVVVGFSSSFNFYQLSYASLHLQMNPGCLLVATNLDAGDMLGDRIMPGGGCMAASIDTARRAAGTTVAPMINVGKPEQYTLDYLVDTYGLDRSRTVMIGDRLDTDIAYGRKGGLKTLLTLTGISTAALVARAPPSERPDFIIPSFGFLRHDA